MPKVKELIQAIHLVTVREASQLLGRGYSRRSITRRIESGEWVEGKHWVDDRRVGATRRIIKINLNEIMKTRSQLAGER